MRANQQYFPSAPSLELSVVIGLDVDGPGILDIVRIGAFAGGR